MSPDLTYYLFEFDSEQLNNAPEHYLVVFWIKESINLKRLSDTIKEYLKRKFAPTKIIFLTPKYNRKDLDSIRNYYQNTHISDSLFFFNPDKNIEFLYFNEHGKIYEAINQLDKPWTNLKINEKITQEGLLTIFTIREGILNSSETSHYEYPSGKHAKKFIRTGNILSIGVEVYFIAYSLLPFLQSNTTEIVCDTSTIISVAEALITLRKCLNRTFIIPNINSFGSYQGLNNFHFENSAYTMVLMSATTSGNLAKKIFYREKPYLKSESIITLYYLSAKTQNGDLIPWNGIGKILCPLDLNKATNPNGYEPIEVFKDGEDCDYCNIHKSLPLKIIGDQFLPEKININTVTIGKPDKPNWLEGFMAEFSREEVLICNRRKRELGDETRELFIDIEKIHKNIEQYLDDPNTLKPQSKYYDYTRRFLKIIEKNIPASLAKIICLDDSASEYIAGQIQNYYSMLSDVELGNDFLIKYKDTEDIYDKIKDLKGGSLLIVGSSVSTSRKLLNISRSIRNNDNISIIYFVGVMRTYNNKDFDNIRMNICYGNMFGRDTHSLHYVYKIHIPDDEKSSKRTIWDDERDLLNKILKYDNDDDFTLAKKEIQDRIDKINNSKEKGLDEIFWGTPNGIGMKLRRGFAFFDFNYDEKDVTQSDVYFTISAVIHNLRIEKVRGTGVQLIQHEHEITLLDPQNFDKLNDGIIQAAILRVAKAVELNYRIDNKYSTQITDIILSIIENKWEASYEFLIAISSGKLKLKIDDLRRVNNKILETSNIDDNPLSKNIFKLFYHFINDEIINSLR